MTTGDSTTTDLNVEILDSMAELLAAMLTRAEEVAQRNGVPIFFLKALHRLDCPMAMKDLGMRMRCDRDLCIGGRPRCSGCSAAVCWGLHCVSQGKFFYRLKAQDGRGRRS